MLLNRIFWEQKPKKTRKHEYPLQTSNDSLIFFYHYGSVLLQKMKKPFLSFVSKDIQFKSLVVFFWNFIFTNIYPRGRCSKSYTGLFQSSELFIFEIILKLYPQMQECDLALSANNNTGMNKILILLTAQIDSIKFFRKK